MDYKFRCVNCAEIIYDLIQCKNLHNICGKCFMKMQKCSICGDQNLQEKKFDEIERKSCKWLSNGCKKKLYIFDDEHPLYCIYKDFICVFCKKHLESNEEDFPKFLSDHFSSECTIKCEILNTHYNKITETKPKKFKIFNLEQRNYFINIGDEYYLLMIPIILNTMAVYVFSTKSFYMYSDYKIKIQNEFQSFERFISFKKFDESILNVNDRVSGKLNIQLENKFLLNSKKEEFKVGKTTIIKNHFVEGEPGSPGNWSKEDYDNAKNYLSNIFEFK